VPEGCGGALSVRRACGGPCAVTTTEHRQTAIPAAIVLLIEKDILLLPVQFPFGSALNLNSRPSAAFNPKISGIRSVLGCHGSDGYFISGFQSTTISPAQPGSAKHYEATQFEGPLLHFAIGVLYVQGQV
jgi:hypothetical protein